MLQRQKTVSAYFTSKQILHFAFAEQNGLPLWVENHHVNPSQSAVLDSTGIYCSIHFLSIRDDKTVFKWVMLYHIPDSIDETPKAALQSCMLRTLLCLEDLKHSLCICEIDST